MADTDRAESRTIISTVLLDRTVGPGELLLDTCSHLRRTVAQAVADDPRHRPDGMPYFEIRYVQPVSKL